ncbi:hypothetical protein [Brachybacterium sp. YJGR34]|uniref:hypothetical protein n=1 Tax=Brachybacterium sp. YJGR34 TaxID=2059911 RepID=UPI000E0A1776|nr:hypothetical protein [Brachybacterium sp. YJGR34]
MTYAMTETLDEHPAQRLTLATSAHFDGLVAALEQAVPALSDPEALRRLAEDGDWAAFVRGLAWESPSGFVRVATSRPSDLLQHAGSRSSCIVWSLAHHAIAARMIRHDPSTMLHSPLRLAAYTTGSPGTTLSLEVPSSSLGGFGLAKIAQAGAELDRALGDLLEDLGLPRPAALRR